MWLLWLLWPTLCPTTVFANGRPIGRKSRRGREVLPGRQDLHWCEQQSSEDSTEVSGGVVVFGGQDFSIDHHVVFR